MCAEDDPRERSSRRRPGDDSSSAPAGACAHRRPPLPHLTALAVEPDDRDAKRRPAAANPDRQLRAPVLHRGRDRGDEEGPAPARAADDPSRTRAPDRASVVSTNEAELACRAPDRGHGRSILRGRSRFEASVESRLDTPCEQSTHHSRPRASPSRPRGRDRSDTPPPGRCTVRLRDGVGCEVVEDPDPRRRQPEPRERSEAELEVVRLRGFLSRRREGDARIAAEGRRRRVAELADPQRCRRRDGAERREDLLRKLAAAGERVRVEEVGPRARRQRSNQHPQVLARRHAGDGHGHRSLLPEEVAQPGHELARPRERVGVRRVDLVPELDECDPRIADVRLEHGAGPPFRALDVAVGAPPVEQRQLDAEPVARGNSDELAQAFLIPLFRLRVADEVRREDDADDIRVQPAQAAEVCGDPLRTPGLPHAGPAGVGGVVADDAELAGDVEPIEVRNRLCRARGRETDRESRRCRGLARESDLRAVRRQLPLNIASM